jgi:hypothetical protein
MQWARLTGAHAPDEMQSLRYIHQIYMDLLRAVVTFDETRYKKIACGLLRACTIWTEGNPLSTMLTNSASVRRLGQNTR